MKFSSWRAVFSRIGTLVAFGLLLNLATAEQPGSSLSASGWGRGRASRVQASSGGKQGVNSNGDSVSKAPAGDYRIGPQDVLTISVWKEPDLSRTLAVRPDGKISLLLIGELEASGRTASELQDAIAEKLRALIPRADVTVIVQEVKSRSFNVVGQVVRPGSFSLVKRTSILDAIALAGGFADFAKVKKIYVLRQRADGSSVKIPFNYRRVIEGEDPEQNISLEPDDTVVVP